MTPALCDVEPFVVTFEDLKMELSEDWNNEDIQVVPCYESYQLQ